MALNFPANPSNGDTYTQSGTTWVFDGTAWNIQDSGAGNISFGTISVDGINVTADNASDSYNLLSGDNITFGVDTNSKSITISSATITGGGETQALTLSVAADDSTQRVIQPGELLEFLGGTGITTSSDAEGRITITATSSGGASNFSELTDATTASLTIDKIYEPAIAMYRVDNVSTSAYTFNSHYSGNNPSITVIGGTTIAFDLDAIPGHPFEIQDPLGDPYNTGLVHVASNGTVSTEANAQGKDSGTLYWRIPESISGGYRYQCQSHVAMVGSITVKRLSVI